MGKDYKMNAVETFFSQAKKAEPPKPAGTPEGYVLVKERKSERLQLLIRPNTKKGLQREADREGISVNELINKVLEEYIERRVK